MPKNRSATHRLLSDRLWVAFVFVLALLGLPTLVVGHQTPTTVVLLDISPDRVAVELQLPVTELALAFNKEIANDPQTALVRLAPQLKEYLLAHIHPYATKGTPWLIEVTDMRVEEEQQILSGPPFQEITVHLILRPQPSENTRKFFFDYDVIMHQVANHSALVSIRSDWEQGKTDETPTEAGIIQVDTRDNVIYPLAINVGNGSWWLGLTRMFWLGVEHIRAGTDHLLFLLVLLLPAMLLVVGRPKRWGSFGGTRYSLTRLLKITAAFTVGHSITLLVGALGWLTLPSQPVEVLIAVSILVSAIHAIRPIFPGKETYVAIGFGLVHGLAFATAIANLNLGLTYAALSILGFNLGIECMQLVVIALVIPWLILLSQTRFYDYIRIGGAVLTSVAAIWWIIERTIG
jgi:hypothetical protein